MMKIYWFSSHGYFVKIEQWSLRVFFYVLFLCRSILAAPEMIPIDDTDILEKTALFLIYKR